MLGIVLALSLSCICGACLPASATLLGTEDGVIFLRKRPQDPSTQRCSIFDDCFICKLRSALACPEGSVPGVVNCRGEFVNTLRTQRGLKVEE